MNLKFLKVIRTLEFEKIIAEIKNLNPQKGVVLEIGAGAGWQAMQLAECGYTVEAIDLVGSIYSKYRVSSITNYDGKKIPFPDSYFDIVFSSGLLEHIPEFKEFQKEIKRILKPAGFCIHIVPSGSWRFWTSITHYIFIFKFMFKLIISKMTFSQKSLNADEDNGDILFKINSVSRIQLMRDAMIPPRHGERGNVFSEIYLFSRWKWRTLFRNAGWKIKKRLVNNLFYTGYAILGLAMPIGLRRWLSYILGSSCHIFILTKERE